VKLFPSRHQVVRPVAALSAIAWLGCSLTACSFTEPADELRFPCDGETTWDPNVPLFLHFGTDSAVPTRTPGFTADLRLFTEGDKEITIFVADIGDGNVVICPDGGLQPSTEYFWTAGPFSSTSGNTAFTEFADSGLRSFTTDDTSDNAGITSWSACSGVKASVYELLECEVDAPDSGDTGQ
jgi:hypothetical protein